jgi:hypothetical protein
MKKDIIKMAKEAGLNVGPAGMGQTVWGDDTNLERFFHIAQAAEREACAEVCDEAKANIWEFHPYAVREAAYSVCTNLAAAIRARGQA